MRHRGISRNEELPYRRTWLTEAIEFDGILDGVELVTLLHLHEDYFDEIVSERMSSAFRSYDNRATKRKFARQGVPTSPTHASGSHGLAMMAPVSSKSATFRVTTMRS
ncbi:hypothetical protein LPU83_pLPU83d_0733 (plasmid) [Rhizobium favelukesii]|uniref:Uncharacterized protein n=1 Tax=Rhizobium favelukesii TaxID=348824 RepID=W6RTL9_9HYPH|nr:hypothetical protein LPU83_pLPU83d_0733 [Rhizobium favelukesii]